MTRLHGPRLHLQVHVVYSNHKSQQPVFTPTLYIHGLHVRASLPTRVFSWYGPLASLSLQIG